MENDVIIDVDHVSMRLILHQKNLIVLKNM